LTEGVEALDEKSFAALAPPYDKATHKDKLVGAGVLKKHPTKPGKHILAKEEGDPSKAIPGDTVTGSGTVTTVPKPKATEITSDQKAALTKKIQSIKEAKKAAMCEDIGARASFVQATQKKAVDSSVQKQKAAAPSIGGSQARLGGNPTSAPAARPAAPARPAMSGSEARTGGSPTSAPAARPAVGGARPSEVAKNSYTGAQTSTGAQVGGFRPSVVAKNSPSQKPYQSGAGAMTNPTQRPYDAKTSPTGATKPVQKLKPVKKQPSTGTVKPTSGGVPTKSARPVRNSTVLGRVGAARKRDKNNDPAGPGNS
jgi:hypothetical protein